MSLSSNSLFHFTSNISNLKSILADKFYGSYCKESFQFNNQRVTLYIPTICFCDIPVESIRNYPDYGNYGIGLNKSWGFKNKLNPVLYLEKHSSLSESLINSLYGSMDLIALTSRQAYEIGQKINSTNNDSNLDKSAKLNTLLKCNQELASLMRTISAMSYCVYSLYFSKHYQDDLERENVIIPDYRFYDEREWRFMPNFYCAVCELKQTEEEYLKWRGSAETKPLLEKVTLTFDYSDIDYIIVKKAEEIAEIKSLIEANSNISIEVRDLTQSKIVLFKNFGQ